MSQPKTQEQTYDRLKQALDMSKNEYIKTKGWGNCVAWSPSGKSLTVANHNSTLLTVDFDSKMAVAKKYLSVYRHLPFTFAHYADEKTLVGSGYDCVPLVFKSEENRWYPLLT